MCLALYIAADQPLPLVPWDDAARPAFHVQEFAAAPGNPLRRYFSKRFLYSAGASGGCGCGFEEGGTSGAASRGELTDYLSAALAHQAEVEVFVCGSGDESTPPKHRRTACPEDFTQYFRTLLRYGELTEVAQQGGRPASKSAATLHIQTEPDGASVRVDDRDLGPTPCKHRDLAPGVHSLKIEKEGFVPLDRQVPLFPNSVADLGVVPLARPNTSITVWRVGCPHDGKTPPAQLPDELARWIEASGFRVRTIALRAAELVDEFKRVQASDDASQLPDVIAGSNYLPLADWTSSLDAKFPRIRASGVLTAIAPFVFLLPSSPGHAAARQVATANLGTVLDSFSWSLDERWLLELPGRLRSVEDRRELDRRNCQAVAAYSAGDLHAIASHLHPAMLGRQGTTRPFVVSDIRTLCVLGNGRLAFVLAAASFEKEQEAGCLSNLSVWTKDDRDWSLLSITNDPASVGAMRDAIPRLVAGMVEAQGVAPRPAELLLPTNEAPTPQADQEYGDFCWTPSSSEDVLAEVAEFHYGDAGRHFFHPGGRVSLGDLWSTGSLWTWRVWSIGRDGQVALSPAGRFEC